jgi:hypothetical protein
MTNKPMPRDDSAPSDDDEHAGLARHLDTSFLINALVPGTREDRQLRRWIRQGLVVAMSQRPTFYRTRQNAEIRFRQGDQPRCRCWTAQPVSSARRIRW